MKNPILKHIGLTLLSVLPLWGCFFQEKDTRPESMDIVRLKLDIEIPDYSKVDTKTDFVDVPSCSRLFVIVFNEAGLRPSVVEASVSGQGFTVNLQPSALPRTLHFLALPSDSPLITILRDDINGKSIDEATFASRLATQNGDAACWARKVLPAGISSSTNLSGIKMVRNYAKVYIRNNTSNFLLEGFRVYNAAKYGMAVPFNGLGVNNTGGFYQTLFPDFLDGDGYMLDYADLSGTQGYRGYNHPSSQLRTPKTSDANTYSAYLLSDGDGTDDACDYIFETRYNPELGNDNAYILFKGKYNAEGNFGSAPSTWYKADFVYDPNPSAPSEWGLHGLEYYDILRNYAYVLTIQGVIGEGHPTAEYAASQPARNNFDGSVAGMDISGVSEVASAMYISHTAIELARTAGISHSFIDLYYHNEFPKDTEANIPGTDVLITAAGQSILNPSVVNSDGTLNLSADGVVSESIASTDPSIADLHLKSGNWWHLRLPITIDVNGTGTLQQTLSIKNRAGLTRHCVISIRPHFPFEIEGYTENPAIVAMERDEPTGGDVIPVNFRIPDGMPSNLFPLVFKVESYSNGDGPTGSTDVTRQIVQPNVTAIDTYKATLGEGDYQIEMPVAGNTYTIVGADASDNADLTYKSYHYTRTLTWAEYTRATADSRSMKSFPIFMEPQYDPRSASTVASLGTTTIWMRQGERNATYFSYKDDAGISTRRYAYEMRVVEPTRIVLPAGDATYNDKPVYEVHVGSPRNLTVGVISSSTGDPTPNTLSLSKTASQISLTYTPAGTGLVAANISVSAVTANPIPVTVVAGNAQDGVITYGGSQDQFYIRTLKGSRTVTFREDNITVLRNQTVSSIYNGSLRVDEDMEADCNTPVTGNLVYSLSPDSVVRSNDYVEIVQDGGHYTLRGKAVNGNTPVKVYAIAQEDENYERAVGEVSVHVIQGVITQDGFWTGATSGNVGVLIPLSGNIVYDELYNPTSTPFGNANISFTTSGADVATVHLTNGTWTIVPRSTGVATLTMHISGTDDNNDGVFGGEGDIFLATDFVQTLTVSSSWWKVLDASYVDGGVYAISESTDQYLMGSQTSSSGFSGTYYYISGASFSPISCNGGSYFASTTNSFVLTSHEVGGYTLFSLMRRINNVENYLLPAGHTWIFETDNNDCLRFYSSGSELTSRYWYLTGDNDDDSIYHMKMFTSNKIQEKYVNYNSSNTRFEGGSANNTALHYWIECASIDEIVYYAGYDSSYYPAVTAPATKPARQGSPRQEVILPRPTP